MGVPLDAIPDHRGMDSHGQRLSLEDLQRLLAEAASILEEKRLLPPAESAFSESFRSLEKLAELRERNASSISPTEAAAVLDEPAVRLIAEDFSDLRIRARRSLEEDVPRDYVALQFAQALLRQEEILDAFRTLDPDESPLQAGLQGTDRDRINELLLHQNLMGRFETLDLLVHGWERFVRGIEDDAKSYGHEEFADRLIARDLLEDALGLISPAGRRDLEHRVRAWDERFHAATRPVPVSTRRERRWRPQRWWWFRVHGEGGIRTHEAV